MRGANDLMQAKWLASVQDIIYAQYVLPFIVNCHCLFYSSSKAEILGVR